MWRHDPAPQPSRTVWQAAASRPGTVTVVIGVRVDGERLRAVLARIAPTLREAAAVVGVSEDSLSAWVNGRTLPAPDTVTRILDAARADLADLLPTDTQVTPEVLRWQAGLTMAAAATATGMSRRRYRDLESGRLAPSGRDVARLAAALHVDPEQVRAAYRAAPVVGLVAHIPTEALPALDAGRWPGETRAEALVRGALIHYGFLPPDITPATTHNSGSGSNEPARG
jgi:transcriptional regulator with XRE-family HTH domain